MQGFFLPKIYVGRLLVEGLVLSLGFLEAIKKAELVTARPFLFCLMLTQQAALL